ncbi:MAG: CoA-binding protein [Planctomycetes bacterium]|nr:CoA-binding protein [Planctomycetota bacterium]
MTDQQRIRAFLDGGPHAVVGASRDPSKYGNMVLRAYVQNDLPVFPVNPNADIVEGLKSYPDLESLPEPVHGVSVITPPHVTDSIIEQAGRLGIRHIWLQPGAEAEHNVQRALQLGMNIIAGGPCLLVALRFRQ